MIWREVTLNTPANNAQICSEQLETMGAVAVSFFDAGDTPILEPQPGTTPLWDKVKIVGLFPEEQDISALKQAILSFAPNTDFTITELPDQEWTRTWLEHFKPMQFGEKLWIVPCDSPLPTENPHAAIIRLDPGLAFGTGTHPTTALCLTWLEAHPPIDHTVIDYGCGSGILGIAALLLGAKKVWAVDYDEQALRSTQDNGLKNQLSSSQLVTLLPHAFGKPHAQLILANILAEPLISLAPLLQQCATSNTTIVLSGLLIHQAAAVQAAYEPWFSFAEKTTQEEWVLLVGKSVN